MKRILRNRLALSTVITTLIILVVSILLASVLTYFAINVVSTRVQEESLYVSNQHIWVNSAGVAEGALMVTNNGGRDVVIHKVSVRGQENPWTDIFYSTAVKTDDLTINLNYTAAPVAAGNNLGLADTAHQANNTSLILPSGSTMVIYINSPDSICINDIGLTVSISLHSSEAVYYSEVNIQATT